jgi:hypothetical protein
MWCCGFAVVVAVLLCKVEVGVVGASAGQPAWVMSSPHQLGVSLVGLLRL